MEKKKPSVLIVDDDPVFRRLMASMLQQEGLQEYTAEDAEDALELLDRNDYHIAVVDYKLPGSSGIDFFEKSRYIRPEMIRILLTAFTSESILLDAINRGEVFRYFTKPVHLGLLQSSLEQALAYRELLVSKKMLQGETERLKAELRQKSIDIEAAFSRIDQGRILHTFLLSLIIEAFFYFNTELQLVLCNSAASDLLGYNRGELLGIRLKDILSDYDLFERKSDQAVRERKPVKFKTELQHRNGSSVQVSVLLNAHEMNAAARDRHYGLVVTPV